jgi:hypothetical protein
MYSLALVVLLSIFGFNIDDIWSIFEPAIDPMDKIGKNNRLYINK